MSRRTRCPSWPGCPSTTGTCRTIRARCATQNSYSKFSKRCGDNMKDIVRIGSGSGFWGDALDPALELLEHGKLDYLSFDFLAELTMALLQRLRAKNPQLGYVPDVIDYMRATMPLAHQSGTKLISN